MSLDCTSRYNNWVRGGRGHLSLWILCDDIFGARTLIYFIVYLQTTSRPITNKNILVDKSTSHLPLGTYLSNNQRIASIEILLNNVDTIKIIGLKIIRSSWLIAIASYSRYEVMKTAYYKFINVEISEFNWYLCDTTTITNLAENCNLDGLINISYF